MYGTIADWRTYAAERGNAAPTTASDADATAALVRASDYIRTRYVLRFSNEYDGTEPEVEEATYIAAARELTTPGFWAATYTPAQLKVLVEVKGIKWQPVGNGSAMGVDGVLPIDPAIDALLLPLTAWGIPAVFTV
jgi:hypothetical protein